MADATSMNATRSVKRCDVTTTKQSATHSTMIHVSLNMSVPFMIIILVYSPSALTSRPERKFLKHQTRCVTPLLYGKVSKYSPHTKIFRSFLATPRSLGNPFLNFVTD